MKDDLKNDRLDEATLSGVGPDDGPSFMYPSHDTYKRASTKDLQKYIETGWNIVSHMIDDGTEEDMMARVYPDGPVGSVSFFPAGDIDDLTPNNQENLFGSEAYDKWKKHTLDTIAKLGWEWIRTKGDDESEEESVEDAEDLEDEAEEQHDEEEKQKEKIKEAVDKINNYLDELVISESVKSLGNQDLSNLIDVLSNSMEEYDDAEAFIEDMMDKTAYPKDELQTIYDEYWELEPKKRMMFIGKDWKSWLHDNEFKLDRSDEKEDDEEEGEEENPDVVNIRAKDDNKMDEINEEYSKGDKVYGKPDYEYQDSGKRAIAVSRTVSGGIGAPGRPSGRKEYYGYIVDKNDKVIKPLGKLDKRNFKKDLERKFYKSTINLTGEAISKGFTKAVEKFREEQLKLQQLRDKQKELVDKFKKSDAKGKKRLKDDLVRMHRAVKKQQKIVDNAESKFNKAVMDEPEELEETNNDKYVLVRVRYSGGSSDMGKYLMSKPVDKKTAEKKKRQVRTGNDESVYILSVSKARKMKKLIGKEKLEELTSGDIKIGDYDSDVYIYTDSDNRLKNIVVKKNGKTYRSKGNKALSVLYDELPSDIIRQNDEEELIQWLKDKTDDKKFRDKYFMQESVNEAKPAGRRKVVDFIQMFNNAVVDGVKNGYIKFRASDFAMKGIVRELKRMGVDIDLITKFGGDEYGINMDDRDNYLDFLTKLNKVMESINEGTNDGHISMEGDTVYVDSNFLNKAEGVLPNSQLKHMGMGEFYLDTPDGEIQFIRTNKDINNFVGRAHRMKDDRGGKLIAKLIAPMMRQGKAIKENIMNESGKIINEKSGRNAPMEVRFENGKLKIELEPTGDLRISVDADADALVRVIEKGKRLKATGKYYYNTVDESINEAYPKGKIDAKKLADKMRKVKTMKGLADKIEKKGGKISAEELDKMLPDYVPGGQISKLFEIMVESTDKDLQRGDLVNVTSKNKSGVVLKVYGRKIHVRFADGSEKTFNRDEVTFIPSEDINEAGNMRKDVEKVLTRVDAPTGLSVADDGVLQYRTVRAAQVATDMLNDKGIAASQDGKYVYLESVQSMSLMDLINEKKFYGWYDKEKKEVDASSLWDAKKKLIKKFNIPRSKESMLAVKSAKSMEKGDFRFEGNLDEVSSYENIETTDKGVVKKVEDPRSKKRMKTVAVDGKKYRYNSSYGTYNSVDGNDLLHKSDIEKADRFSTGTLAETVQPSDTMKKVLDIVQDKQHQKVDGQDIDLTTAGIIKQVWEKANRSQREKLNQLKAGQLANLAYKMIK